jgi:hypothetical protein
MSEIAKWHSFYVIVGSAAGALIGLQFVVITLIADNSPVGAAEAGAAFSSPTIAHFGAALFLSALLHAPWQTIAVAAALWGVLGFGGVAFSVIVARRMRKQAAYEPVFEDWLFYVGPAFHRVCSARGVVLRGSLPHPRSPVRCWRGGAALALHRNPQLLGQRCLPCAGREGKGTA